MEYSSDNRPVLSCIFAFQHLFVLPAALVQYLVSGSPWLPVTLLWLLFCIFRLDQMNAGLNSHQIGINRFQNPSYLF